VKTLEYGDRIYSPGGSYTYEVIGLVCPLYDREKLDYPHCRIEWKDCRGNGKAPAWNRQGKRFVVDIATRKHPSYAVRICGTRDIINLTLFWLELNKEDQEWWYSKTPYLKKISHQELCQPAT